VPGFLFAALLRFAAAALVRLFGVLGCNGIQTAPVPVGSAEDRSRERLYQLRASYSAGACFPAAASDCVVPGSSASKAQRCAGSFDGRPAALRASALLYSARTAAHAEAHGVDLTLLREALALGRDHEALPWGAADGQWGRDAVVAALVRLRNTKRKPTGK